MKIKQLSCANSNAYIIDEIDKVSSEEINSLLIFLPEWRREKALTFSNSQGRKENVLSFLLLKKVLENLYGIKDEINFLYLNHGKPLLANYPYVFFNLSHCRKGVACVVGSSPVGVDIERRGRYKENLALKVLNADEYNYIKRCDDIDLAFTILWTKKEALVKLKGIGVGNKMREVLKDEKKYTFSEFIEPEYVCCIAETKKSLV